MFWYPVALFFVLLLPVRGCPAYGQEMPLAIGDSIAQCLVDAGADYTEPPSTKIGATPQWVLDTVRDIGELAKGYTIALSPGWANIPNTPHTLHLQLEVLKANRAKEIVVVGPNGSPLEVLSKKDDVRFQGFKPGGDGVHPENCNELLNAIMAYPPKVVIPPVKPAELPPPVAVPIVVKTTPAAAPPSEPADPDPLLVPIKARPYQRTVIREARAVWGLNAPTSMIGAQLQTESAWNPNARSPYAAGLAQFIPATAAQMAREYPQTLGSGDVMNPQWAIRAMNQYDHDLFRMVKNAATDCDHYAFTLSSYNGGFGWISRDRALCEQHSGCDIRRWFGHVEKYSNRAPQFIRENRVYETRILFDYQPSYRSWGGYVQCFR